MTPLSPLLPLLPTGFPPQKKLRGEITFRFSNSSSEDDATRSQSQGGLRKGFLSLYGTPWPRSLVFLFASFPWRAPRHLLCFEAAVFSLFFFLLASASQSPRTLFFALLVDFMLSTPDGIVNVFVFVSVRGL